MSNRPSKNALFLVAGLLLVNASAFIVNAALARSWGSQVFGGFASLVAAWSFVALFSDAGLFLAGTKRIAELRGRNAEHEQIRQSIHSFQLAFLLTGLAGAVVFTAMSFALPFGRNHVLPWSHYALMGLWILAYNSMKSRAVVFYGFESMERTLWSFFLLEPLKLLMVLVLILTQRVQLYWIIHLWTAAYAIMVIVSFATESVFVKEHLGPGRGGLPFHEAQRCLTQGVPYFLSFMSNAIITSLTVSIVGLLSGSRQAALTAAGFSLSASTILLLEPVSNAILPLFSFRFAKVHSPASTAASVAMFRLAILASTFIALLLIVFGPRLLPFIFGQTFLGADTVVILLALAVFFDALRLIIDPLLNSAGRANLVSRIECLRYAVLIPALLVGVHFHGAQGGAAAVLASSCCATSIRFLFVHRVLQIPTFTVWLSQCFWAATVAFCLFCGLGPFATISLGIALPVATGYYRKEYFALLLRSAGTRDSFIGA